MNLGNLSLKTSLNRRLQSGGLGLAFLLQTRCVFVTHRTSANATLEKLLLAKTAFLR
ncbi:hypothetical protein [Campylobacter upsaliensis]|uniref:hypothetical protein n=1 Tax=Campylobacter upsaliensis TaxID=28080 RepID=UPI002149DE3F|nr:hypothetical protein [Campylobacter upsaliensis]MCR2098550.1 hypothetical protein [Campylobacter upsaliensis]MCR2109842.1 hypothetical protein [Campylobacter upsaliensis]MCR2111211.1 hypothetical protein [Campylobacter upsaliensis]